MQPYTWDIIPMPPGANPISRKWIYKIKIKSDGSIKRYNVCLVARGFTQEYGINYETFAFVAKMTSNHTLIALAAAQQWPLYQIDVKNAFLNDDLSEVVYMQPPPGVFAPPGHVHRLRRAFYGLKQAPRARYDHFQQSLLSVGYTQSMVDYTMFRRSTSHGIILLILYVDDMIITGSDDVAIASLKRHL